MKKSIFGFLAGAVFILSHITSVTALAQGDESNCLPVISTSFSDDHLSVEVSSSKDLSNIVLKFGDGSTQKFDDLSGSNETFSGTNEFLNLCISGIWVKSGCNSSGDGPGYGEFIANANWSGICPIDLEIPDFVNCNDISIEQKLYEVSSSTSNGSIIHSLWMPDLFQEGTARFDFTEGQMLHDENGAEVYGSLNLRSGGGTKNGTSWKVYLKYDPTDIVNPKKELGQDENLTETWVYYVLNSNDSYLIGEDDQNDVVTFTHMGNPFQIGLSAGGKDLNEFSASGWFNWFRADRTGRGDVNINAEDLCPPAEKISPILECVDLNADGTYTAHFGYLNDNDINIIIPISSKNKFTPSPIDQGQPFIFLPGRQVDIFQVPFDGSNLVWTLTSPNGSTRTSTASDNPAQRCITEEICKPTSITGGTIAFNGPYNPEGTNTIINTELPSSPYAELGFEYVWLQSNEDVPNTPGNTSWAMIEGSENLTELQLGLLFETTYFIRCARLVGCEDYWGETPSVEVEVNPCTPASITGGTIAFNGPYNPEGTNTIINTELPSSPYAELGFEYVWLQSNEDVPNTPGNTSWAMIEGSENLTELELGLLFETTYFIRCARLVGCDDYWGETPSVEVEVNPCTPASITGGTIAFNGPYNPEGANTIINTELPSSPYAELGFEYVWLQSNEDVPNTPGNTSWAMIEGSENLTELELGLLFETTYFIRCARLVGCDDYWGETPSVEVEVNPCTPASITGGTIAFNGPYNPEGTNTIINTELPSSPYAELGFEYVWLQSTEDVPNTPGNTSWAMIEGSENLTELQLGLLFETTYFIRCARLVGCDDYWGETPSVEVEVNPCTPASITGGTIAFNGPYNPEATNTIINTELPSSPYAELGFEYVWLQSTEDVPNTPGNTSWAMIEGSENLTELELGLLFETTYFIRCARLVGCEDYWGESNVVTVNGFEIPTATLSGGGEICEGETSTISIVLTGIAPFTVIYTNGIENTEIIVNSSEYSFEAIAGTYTLVEANDINYPAIIDGEAIITTFDTPTATLSGGGLVCGQETALLTIQFSGAAPFDITYSDGSVNTSVTIEDNSYSFEAVAGNYSLLSINDRNCSGTVSGNAVVTEAETPTAFLSGGGSVCGDDTLPLTITFTGNAPFDVIYSDGTVNIPLTINENVYVFDGNSGNYSLLSVSDANCNGTVSGEAVVSEFELPTAIISGDATVCNDETSIVTIDLTGTSPWQVTYTDGIDQFELNATENSIELGLPVGNYSLISVNDLNCTGSTSGSATINEYEIPTATFVETSISSCEGGSVPLEIILTGNSPWTIEYAKNGSPITVESSNDVYTFDATEGDYELISVSDNFCSGTVSGEVSVIISAPPTATISGNEQFCGDPVNLLLQFTGQGPWTYSIEVNRNIITNLANESTVNLEVTEPGEYSLISVTGGSLCEGTVSGLGVVLESVVPTGSIIIDESACVGNEIVLDNNIVGFNYTYLWSTSGSGMLIDANSQRARYVSDEEELELEFTLEVFSGCEITEFNSITNIYSTSAQFEIDPAPENGVLLANVEYTFTATDSESDSYDWDFDDGSTSTGSVVVHTFLQRGIYNVSLLTSKGDCSDSFSFAFEVSENENLFIPNVFNPTSLNEDNNSVKIYGENISQDGFEFAIYNRWGQIVYRTSNLRDAQSSGWNGQNNGENKENNVFTYIVRGKFNNGESFEKTGAVTLVK